MSNKIKIEIKKDKKEDKLEKNENIWNLGEKDFLSTAEKEISNIKKWFGNYRSTIFKVMFSYISVYGIWKFITWNFPTIISWLPNVIRDFIYKFDPKENLFCAIFVGILMGALYIIEALVTARLKNPLQTFIYYINSSSTISEETKEKMINESANSAEACREGIKKLGMFTIITELLLVLVDIGIKSLGENKIPQNGKESALDTIREIKKRGKYALIILLLPYFIGFAFSIYGLYNTYNEIQKVQKEIDNRKENNSKDITLI